MKRPFSIYLTGVGGQGVGLTSEVLSRAIASAGFRTIVSDTHGLAQRGGRTASHLRIGDGEHPPQIPPGEADLVIALERLEAVRGAAEMLRHGGHLVYCDAVFQPASVRVGNALYPHIKAPLAICAERSAECVRIPVDAVSDPKMYNTMLLARLTALHIVPGLTLDNILNAIAAALPGPAFARNKALFLSLLTP